MLIKKKRSGLVVKDSNNLIKAVCEAAVKKREKVVINGNDYKTKDGTPIRDFIHVSDLAEIHLIVAEHINSNGSTGIYNCGYGLGYSVKEVLEEMEKILNHNIKKELGPRREDDTDIRFIHLNHSNRALSKIDVTEDLMGWSIATEGDEIVL